MMMEPVVSFGAIALGLVAVMALVWAATLRPGRSGWIEVVWSLATGLAACLAALVPLDHHPIQGQRRILVAALMLAWGLRLGLHIASRTSPGHDDPRYAALRVEWGDNFALRSFWFLQIQALAALFLAAMAELAAHNTADGLPIGGWRLQDALAATIMLLGMGGEALADRQLHQFRRDPARRGQVCDRGLWGLSRHPNYFCEWLVWAGLAAFAIDASGAYLQGWLALAGPVMMYILLVYVSGIPPLEAHMLRTRGDEFRAYQARVSAFWPWSARSE